MNYSDYIAYHKRGDAGVEERMIASLCRRLHLSEWDSFRLMYFYTMTYHIPSALRILSDPSVKQSELTFRTDRRYVRCNGAYDRLLRELSTGIQSRLKEVTSTQAAYDTVKRWFFFGRYTAFLFLEVYSNAFKPKWADDVTFAWEPDENYTLGAIEVAKSNDHRELDKFLEHVKIDTKDNAFAIETSLCAVAKFAKGTRYDGYYTERMIREAKDSDYGSLILSLVLS